MAKESNGRNPEKLTREQFDHELLRLQRELVIMQEYVRTSCPRSTEPLGRR